MRRQLLALACALALGACSDSGGGDTTDFDGVIASDNLSGTISVSVPAALASVASPSFSGAVSQESSRMSVRTFTPQPFRSGTKPRSPMVPVE
ncbi:MAG TPA: hypothetical protein VNO52_16550 [Methylomirabilota bacterium]|nr:hypothetical protein [Methylomirabilota bacterium]